MSCTTNDELIAAFQALANSLAIYRDQLRAAGATTDADRVGVAHGNVLETLLQVNARAMQDDLAHLDQVAAVPLRTITNTIAEKTSALDRAEATVTWVIGLAGAVVAVLVAAGTGTLPTAIMALWNIFNNKPIPSGG